VTSAAKAFVKQIAYRSAEALRHPKPGFSKLQSPGVYAALGGTAEAMPFPKLFQLLACGGHWVQLGYFCL
jgi:hypothetical protein